MALERVPFEVAISDPLLLKKAWERLSLPQQVALKAVYGLPLKTEKEILIWSGFQGAGIYDDLGYLTGIKREVPYVPKEYQTVTGIFGRRSGKSTEIGGFGGAYEITLGGHTRFAREGQDLIYLYVAQDLSNATMNMKGITLTLMSSKLLEKELAGPPGVEEAKFKNGIILRAQPNNVKASRGSAIVGATLDELGFWYKDSKSANPDKEVEISISAAMTQFEPAAKQWRFTTPWTKEGLAYEAFIAGTEGRNFPKDTDADIVEQYEDHLVLYAPTAAMDIPEPLITRGKLRRKKKRDPEAYEREFMAKFIDSTVGFLAHAKINEAVDTGVTAREPIPSAPNVAVMDPAFRGDTYVLAVGHMDSDKGFVQDFVQGWTPLPGERLNPAVVLDEIKPILEKYELSVVYSDQYQLESLQQLAMDRDFVIFGVDLTKVSKPKVMQNLATMLNQGKAKLLDHAEQTRQLKELRKTVTPSGHVQVAAPPGDHDDYATALALLIHQALQLPAIKGEEVAAALGPRNPDRDNYRKVMLQRLHEQFEARLAAGDPEAVRAAEWTDYINAITDDEPTRQVA